MNPFSVVAKDILVNNGVGLFGTNNPAGFTIFIGNEPDKPNNAITIYDAPAEAPNPKFLLDYPRILIRVRATEYLTGHAKAEEGKDLLLGLAPQDIDGVRYDGVFVVVDTHFLRKDQEGRSIFVTTYRAIREPPEPSANRQSL